VERGLAPPPHGYTPAGYSQGAWGQSRSHGQPAWSPSAFVAPPAAPSRPPNRWKPARAPPPGPTAEAAPASVVKWICLGEDAPFLQQGLPDMAPAVWCGNDLQALLRSSQQILEEMAGGSAASVTLTHDANWDGFPEVGAAWKEAGGGEDPLCVALCSDYGLWAVGLGSKWKVREQAARLALCVALAASTDTLGNVATQYPDFVALCDRSNIAISGLESSQAGPVPTVRPSTPPRNSAKRPKPPQLVPPPTGELAGSPNAARWQAAASRPASGGTTTPNGAATLPRDVPLWITLPAGESPEELEGLPTVALALSTEGKGRKTLYSNADRAVAHLLEEMAAEVQYFDDFNWEQFPQVGAALKSVAAAEECLTLALCSSKEIWAVGVGMQGKNRFAAAKAALAATLILQAEDAGEELDLSEFPVLAEFVQEARNAKS